MRRAQFEFGTGESIGGMVSGRMLVLRYDLIMFIIGNNGPPTFGTIVVVVSVCGVLIALGAVQLGLVLLGIFFLVAILEALFAWWGGG